MRPSDRLLRRTPLDIPLSLLGLSALAGQYVSYDPSLGWVTLLYLLSGIGLCYALAATGPTWRASRSIAAGLLAAGAVLAAYFVTQYAHLGYPDKVHWITRLGTSVGQWFPQVAAYRPHPNSVATFLEGLLPLGFALLLCARRLWLRLLYASGLGLIAVALVISASRGAWVALFLTALVWLCVRLKAAWILALLLGIAVLIVFAGGLVAGDQAGLAALPLLGKPLASLFARPDRLELYRNALYLILDFPFTGIGLGTTFTMVYARYVLLIQVPFMGYSHNLFLEAWLNQGLLGIVGLLWLVASFCRFVAGVLRRGSLRTGTLFHGAWLGVATGLLHGLSDACQYADGWPFLPLFALLGLAVAEGRRGMAHDPQAILARAGPRLSTRWRRSALGAVLAVSFIGLALAWRPIVAAGYANAGAVTQARGQLRGDLSDAERESLLRRASGLYRRALGYHGGNATSHQRLGLLAMDAGRYENAVAQLESAFDILPGNPGTRKALGLAYVWVGRLDKAHSLLGGVPNMVEELNTWAWWWSEQGERKLAANAYRMSMRLQPGQESVERALSALEQE